MWHSLRVRLLLATILVVLIAVGVTAFVATRRTEGEFQRYVEQRSPLDDRRMGYVLAHFYEENGGWKGVETEAENLAHISGQQVVLADADGQIIADSAGKLVGKPVDTRWPRPAAIIIRAVFPSEPSMLTRCRGRPILPQRSSRPSIVRSSSARSRQAWLR